MKKIGKNKTYVLEDLVYIPGDGNPNWSPISEPVDIFRRDNFLEWEYTGKNSLSATPNKVYFEDKSGNTIAVRPDSRFEQFLNKDYYDIVFDSVLPYIKIGPDTLTELGSVSMLDIEAKQKYFNKDYEKFIERKDIDELDLLNYYILLSKDIRKNEDIETILSQDKRLNSTYLENEKYAELYFQQYPIRFDEWATDYKNKYKNKFGKIVLDLKQFDKITSQYSKRQIFTKYVKLNLFKDTIGEIGQSLVDTRMNIRLFSRLIFDEVNPPSSQFRSSLSYLTKENDTSLDIRKNIIIRGRQKLNFTDYSGWVSSSVTNRSTDTVKYFDFSSDSDVLYIGSTENTDVPTTENNEFLSSLYTRVLAGKTRFIADKHLRTYKDMLDGKKCYSEVVGFRITKTAKDSSAPNVAKQVYYLENNESDLLEFIDTQIKSNSIYSYSIDYYVAVLGNKYSYSRIPRPNIPEVGLVPKIFSSVIGSFGQPINNQQNQTSAQEDVTIMSSPQMMLKPETNSEPPEQQVNLNTGNTVAIAAPVPSGGRPKDATILYVINDPLIRIYLVPAVVSDSEQEKLPETAVIPKPPLTPIVTPIPFKDDRKKIRFNFQQNIGIDKSDYIKINSLDEENYKKIIASQSIQRIPKPVAQVISKYAPNTSTNSTQQNQTNTPTSDNSQGTIQKPVSDGKVEFETELTSDGSAEIEDYEIFKLEVAPLSFNDFKNINPILIDNKKASENITQITSFDDFLEPNKKYYYMFRSINTLGYRSNPSPIYEVELVINSGDTDYQNSGAYYAIITPYEFPKQSGASKARSFKQYLKLRASFINTLVKDADNQYGDLTYYNDNENSDRTWHFGDVAAEKNSSVWGKKFKIRITSKQTSRKIDINFTMKANEKVK